MREHQQQQEYREEYQQEYREVRQEHQEHRVNFAVEERETCKYSSGDEGLMLWVVT